MTEIFPFKLVRLQFVVDFQFNNRKFYNSFMNEISNYLVNTECYFERVYLISTTRWYPIYIEFNENGVKLRST